MKKIGAHFFITFFLFSGVFAQTGPGGVGSTDGTSNLDFWFDASKEVYNDVGTTLSTNNQTVQQWNDQSGNNHNAAQGTSAKRPIYKTSILNGYPVVEFDGTKTTSANTNLMSFAYSHGVNIDIFVVVEGSYISQNQLINISGNGGVTLSRTSATNLRGKYYDGTTTGSVNMSIIDGDPFIANYDFNAGGNSELYNMGTSVGAATSNARTVSAGTTYIGNHGSAIRPWNGGVAEVFCFRGNVINDARRIIINNYLAAKYGLSLTSNDTYDEDDTGYDHDVAGIGRVDASNIHNDAQGTGMVRILNPGHLDDDEFLIWGHDNGVAEGIEKTDIPVGIQARFERVWRVSERNAANTSDVNVGTVDMRFDLTGLGSVTATDLRLLIDLDDDGTFADETPISGATSLGSNIYEFSQVPGGAAGLENNRRFTLATINSIQTPLPIELINFTIQLTDEATVKLSWKTLTETNNDYFTIERSKKVGNWEVIDEVVGAGNSSSLLSYHSFDNKPYIGISYYRLKQTDFDGEYSYSDIVAVDSRMKKGGEIVMYPNPVNDQLTILNEEMDLEKVSIYNVLGKEIVLKGRIVGYSESKIIIDFSALASGVYYVKVNNKIQKFHKK